MKKAYIAPSSTGYEVKTSQMLALSLRNGHVVTEDNEQDFEVYSNRTNESIWSDNTFKNSPWE